MAERYQVIIVGGGPVGAALGVELGMRGVSCAVVERYPEPQRIPKGQNLSQRTLEHFYFWGIVNELRAARVMPNNYPIGGVTAYKHLMSDYWYTPPGREAVQSFYYEENERLPPVPHGGRPARETRHAHERHDVLRLERGARRAGRARRARRDRRDERRARRLRVGRVRRGTGCALQHGRRAPHARSRLRRGLRRRSLDGARVGGHRVERRELRAEDAPGSVQVARAARGVLTLPRGDDVPRARPGVAGLLDVLRTRGRGRGVVLPRAGAERHGPGELRLPGAAEPRRGVRVPRRVRPRGVLGPARHRGGLVPQRAALHRRRRRAQPSAVRGVRTEQRAGGRRQPRLEARRGTAGMGRRGAAGLVRGRSDAPSSGKRGRTSSLRASGRTGSSWNATARSATGQSSRSGGSRWGEAPA